MYYIKLYCIILYIVLYYIISHHILLCHIAFYVIFVWYCYFRYSGPGGRRVGLALDAAAKLFPSSPDKSAKKIVFVITSGRSSDDPKGPAGKLRGMGATIYGIGAGPGAKPNDLKPISNQFISGLWKYLPKNLLKIQAWLTPCRFLHVSNIYLLTLGLLASTFPI